MSVKCLWCLVRKSISENMTATEDILRGEDANLCICIIKNE